MKKVILILFVLSNIIIAQDSTLYNPDSTKAAPPPPPPSKESKVYYGGNVYFSFWNDYFYIGLFPMVGYKLTPQLSAGLRVGYSYISDSKYSPTLTSHNYGGGVFTRYSIIPQLYAKAEFLYFSYEHPINITLSGYETERVWVPFLLLGAGFSQRISNNASAFVEVLFDVIQDPNSPYEAGDPWISVGVGVGI